MSSSERRPVSAGSVTEQLRRAATRTVAAWAPRLGRWLAAGAAVAAAMVAVAKVPAMLAVVGLLFAFRRMLRRQHGRRLDRGGGLGREEWLTCSRAASRQGRCRSIDTNPTGK